MDTKEKGKQDDNSEEGFDRTWRRVRGADSLGTSAARKRVYDGYLVQPRPYSNRGSYRNRDPHGNA